MIIEGKNVVLEAIKSGQTINNLYILNGQNDKESRNIISLAREKKIKINFCEKIVLDKKAQSKTHQGFLAEIVDYEYATVEDILSSPNNEKLVVVLDEIKDPHNLGAIIRSCECCGVDGIIISKNRCACVNDTVIKTSAGAIANVKIARVININQTLDKLKENGFWVYGAELGGKELYSQNLKGNIAIVVGSEGEGISTLTKQKCDDILTIPMKGQVNSLNASVACSVVLFEALRQRG